MSASRANSHFHFGPPAQVGCSDVEDMPIFGALKRRDAHRHFEGISGKQLLETRVSAQWTDECRHSTLSTSIFWARDRRTHRRPFARRRNAQEN